MSGYIINTSALRLLALRGLRTLRIRRVALRAPEVTQSNLFYFSYGSEDINSKSTALKIQCQ